ncbi:MAG: c-type cytochrome biogenesis protein CcsB, partial [Brachybacterium tyrofermentans]
MIDQQLAEISNLAIVVTIVLYVLALIGFSADLASTSQKRSDERLAAREAHEAARAKQSVTAGATGTAGPAGTDSPAAAAGAAPAGAGEDAGATGARSSAASSSSMTAQTFAFILAVAATVLHIFGVATRAAATQRVPWTNMYEFATTSTAVVMVAFLIFSIKRAELRILGTFVIGPVLLVLLLAQTLWIVPAAELTPSLQNSHWLYIHISVAIMSTALSILGAVVASLQLLQARHERALVERVS